MGKFFIVVGILVLVLSVYISKMIREELSAVPADVVLQGTKPVAAAPVPVPVPVAEKARAGVLTHAQERLTNRVPPVQEERIPDGILAQ